MVFSGKLEQTLTLPAVQTVSLWLVWLLRKKTAKVPPLNPQESVFLEYGMKKFLDCVFFDGESFVHASFTLLQLSVCF